MVEDDSLAQVGGGVGMFYNTLVLEFVLSSIFLDCTVLLKYSVSRIVW